MQHQTPPPPAAVRFYASASYPCSYLEGQTSRSLVATPHHLIDSSVYGFLLGRGFRRSGNYTYRPWCEHCNQCVPVRLSVASFQPNRSQRRALAYLQGMDVRLSPPSFDAQQFELYQRYQSSRHTGSSMDSDKVEQYEQLLLEGLVDTRLVTFSTTDPASGNTNTRMVSLIDVVSDGLSAVYTFFDPSDRNGLGSASIVWLVNYAKQLGLPYVYLGYWIKDSPKMAYKANFKPQQRLIEGVWRDV
jgi:arginyl-tRNA--protein-N-Asp/Glu arginylyltransferase